LGQGRSNCQTLFGIEKIPDVVIGASRHEDAGGEPLDRLLGGPKEVNTLLAPRLELAK
jgi:hypothetical protein